MNLVGDKCISNELNLEEKKNKRDEALKSFYKKTNKYLFSQMNLFLTFSFLIGCLIGVVLLLFLVLYIAVYPDVDLNPIVTFVASLLVGVINFTLFGYLCFIVDTIRCKVNGILLHNKKDVSYGYIKYIYDFIKGYHKDSKKFLTNIFIGSWIFNFVIASINDLLITDIYILGVIVSSFVFAIFSTILFKEYIDCIYSRIKSEYDIFR